MKFCRPKKPKQPRYTKEDWRKEYEWHFHFVWWPMIIEVGDIVCFVWLCYIQRRAAEQYHFWSEFPNIREYQYRIEG